MSFVWKNFKESEINNIINGNFNLNLKWKKKGFGLNEIQSDNQVIMDLKGISRPSINKI
jgi:hypothetical protein